MSSADDFIIKIHFYSISLQFAFAGWARRGMECLVLMERGEELELITIQSGLVEWKKPHILAQNSVAVLFLCSFLIMILS